MRWTYKYSSCGLRRARVDSSEPTTHQRVQHQYCRHGYGRPQSTANKTNDIARHTPFIALRKRFAPFFCSLRCYAGSCIRSSENTYSTHSGEYTPLGVIGSNGGSSRGGTQAPDTP
jgi:hypothetical protein